jgi:hypothetical protein
MQADPLPACGALRSRTTRQTEVDLCWIARRLGLLDNERRTIIDKVRRLAEHHGFPLPKRPRFVRGVRILGPRSIDAYSVWDRDPVERWIEDDRPPAESAALAAVRKHTVRHELSSRAARLVISA